MIRIFTFLFTLSISFTAFAQVDDDAYVYGDDRGSSKDEKKSDGKFDWDRVTLGGGLGATFGDITYFEIAPTM